MRAAEVCAKAAELVGGDREAQHGPKLSNFTRIAALWQGWLNARQNGPLHAHDVAVMMALLKLARTQTGDFNADDYIDAAGYAGCALECSPFHT